MTRPFVILTRELARGPMARVTVARAEKKWVGRDRARFNDADRWRRKIREDIEATKADRWTSSRRRPGGFSLDPVGLCWEEIAESFSSVGVLVAVALVVLAFLLLDADWGRLLRRRASRPLLVGALIGALVTATTGLMLTGASQADPEHPRDVFRAIALPGNEPPGLTDVRLVESPIYGLGVSVQLGTELVYVCFGTPDQVRNGSCATPETELIRERRPGDGDIRVQRIVRFVGLSE